MLYDTENLRIHAVYEIEVFDDVYWVPVNQLGGTRYTAADIESFIGLPPEQKQEKIHTLYEAVQLFQIGKFRGLIDNISEYHVVNDAVIERWDFHKPGYHVVRTNEGCCASDTNWLMYLLRGKYEQMGYIQYAQKDGNGHIINYIYHKGWYYMIDMMMYRYDSLTAAGKETGTKEGYKAGTSISGNLHKSRSPLSFVEYCLSSFQDAPVLFTMSAVTRSRNDRAYIRNGQRSIRRPFKENGRKRLYIVAFAAFNRYRLI